MYVGIRMCAERDTKYIILKMRFLARPILHDAFCTRVQ